MLTAVTGSFVGANYDNVLNAAAAAVTAMGLCGELAYKRLQELDGGTNTYRMLLIDYMSKLDVKVLRDGAKIESR
jgi:hydroxyethylthiazole kinase